MRWFDNWWERIPACVRVLPLSLLAVAMFAVPTGHFWQ
jgi:hypothetical protein